MVTAQNFYMFDSSLSMITIIHTYALESMHSYEMGLKCDLLQEKGPLGINIQFSIIAKI